MRAALAVAGLIAALIGGAATAQTVQTTRPFSGPVLEMEVAAAVPSRPDYATLRMGVVGTAGTTSEALETNARRISAMLAAIRAAGVAPADLQTTSVSVDRSFNNGRPAGYRASNTVEVRVRDLERIGRVIDAGLNAGADRLQRLQLEVENPAPLAAQARALALQEAERKAADYAKAGGWTAARLLSLSERDVSVRDNIDSGEEVVVTGSRVSAPGTPRPATPVLAGDVNVVVRLYATFELTR